MLFILQETADSLSLGLCSDLNGREERGREGKIKGRRTGREGEEGEGKLDIE